MRTAVILPTWSRVEQAALCTRRLLDTSSADVIVVTEDDISDWLNFNLFDEERFLFESVSPSLTAIQKWNHGLKLYPDYDAYILGAVIS